jgi:hypothetical protein
VRKFIKKLLIIPIAFVVIAAAAWLGVTSLSPTKAKTDVVRLPPPPLLRAVGDQSANALSQSGPSPTLLPSASPAVGLNPAAPAGKKATQATLPTQFSPPLVVSATPPSVNGAILPIKQGGDNPAVAQNYSNAEAANFEPTTLTVIRTFFLTMPDGSQVEKSLSIPVLYRKGSIALKPDQLDELGAINSEIQRILDANEELRVAADLLIAKQRKVLAGSVPIEVLSQRSASVLPGGTNAGRINYLNLPQGSVEIAPAREQ